MWELSVALGMGVCGMHYMIKVIITCTVSLRQSTADGARIEPLRRPLDYALSLRHLQPTFTRDGASFLPNLAEAYLLG